MSESKVKPKIYRSIVVSDTMKERLIFKVASGTRSRGYHVLMMDQRKGTNKVVTSKPK